MTEAGLRSRVEASAGPLECDMFPLMPKSSSWAAFAAIFVVAGVLLYAGWTALDRDRGSACSVCGRPVHMASRVDGSTEGRILTFCCAACALRAEGQGAQAIRLTRVFDYDSGEALDPAHAVAVVGSDVNLCMRDHVLMDSHKEASELHFDRCSPSVLAFENAEAAETFQKLHGGVVRPVTDLDSAVR